MVIRENLNAITSSHVPQWHIEMSKVHFLTNRIGIERMPNSWALSRSN